MRPTLPLFRVDPGWLFIAAGLALCAAVVIVPAQQDLFTLRRQLDELHAQERLGNERLRIHVDVLTELEQPNAGLTRRLAAAQLNLVPATDRPVFLTSQEGMGVTDWIDAGVQVDHPPARQWPDTALSRLAGGPHRLWLLGAGMVCAFIGLLLGPGARVIGNLPTDA
jgi:hypothetical protein